MAEDGGDAKGRGSTPTVFISYASQDAAVANSIVETLEQHGLRCWQAPRDVKPGTQYADAIVRAINDANAVVPVLSASAVQSAHVGREVERAASKHKPIIAFRIDSAPLVPALEYFLGESQWIDVVKLGMPAALTKLADTLGQGPRDAAAADPAVSARPVARTRAKAKLLAAAAVVVSAVVAVLGVRFWSQSYRAASPAAAMVVTDKSIAVLPFIDRSEKRDQEYFGDGMAEEILNLLAKIPELKVIGRTSSFSFKGKQADLPAIGKALGTAYVVEGSVGRSDKHVRVAARLVDTRDGTYRWSETYDRGVSDVLVVQEEIALAIVRALQLEVASTVFRGSQSASPSADAYDAYLRGLHARDRFDQLGFEQATADFRHALQLEPSFTPAAEAAASTLYYMAEMTYLSPESGFNQARAEAEAALKLDPGSSVAHAVICIVNTIFDWDWSAAARECAIAARISPNKPFVLQAAAVQHMALGEWKDAASSIEAAIASDPLDPAMYNIAARIYVRAGRVREAETAVRRSRQISPTFAFDHLLLGITLLMQGRATEALAEMQQESGPGAQALGLAVAYHALQRDLEADAALARLKAENGSDSAFSIAEAYAFRKQKDPAFEWLNRAFAQRDNGLYSLKGAPLLRNLEGDPRYKAFLRKMKLPE